MPKEQYNIEVMETAKSQIPLRKSMKDGVIPRFPSSIMISGKSGSGKTNLLMNMFTNKKLYGAFFHTIIVYSPTASAYDDVYDVLKLPKENFIKEFGQEQLEELIEARKKLIDSKGIAWVAKNSRVAIIMDDVIANRGFLQSATALKLFALLRHFLCSIYCLIQSYRKLPRSLRLNCNGVYVFPSLQSEVEVLLDEITPSGIKKRDFEKVLEYCTEGQYDFMAINNHAKPGERIRKNLNEVIDLNKYKSLVTNKKKDELFDHETPRSDERNSEESRPSGGTTI
jgi:hypothetical protein